MWFVNEKKNEFRNVDDNLTLYIERLIWFVILIISKIQNLTWPLQMYRKTPDTYTTEINDTKSGEGHGDPTLQRTGRWDAIIHILF